MTMKRAWLAAFAWLAVALAQAAAPAIPEGFGISVHQVNDPREWQSIADAGFRIVRLDLTWEQVETAPGRYDWSYHDGMVAAMGKVGLKPLLILDYGNAVHTPHVAVEGKAEKKAAAPSAEREVDAFAKFAAEAVRHFKGANPVWEIWNEPEHHEFWPPKSDAAQFVRLATRTCEAMRRADPAATIYSPGAAKSPTRAEPSPAFLRTVLDSSLPACLSGVSVHPYLFVDALDDTPQTWSNLRAMLAKSPAVREGFTLASTESGVSTFKGKVSDAQQASYLVRMMLLNAEANVPISIWYDWRDDGDNADDPQHRFGVVRRDLSRKPAWQAMQTMTSKLRGARLGCRLSPARAGFTALAFGAAGNTQVVAWRAGWGTAPQRVPVGRSAAVRSATDMLGQPVAFKVIDAQTVEVPLALQPVYLDLGSARIDNAACDAAAAR
jgi:polysaccharide biosynthesis protein PslG